MSVRDLSYRAYEGARRSASDNLWVLARFGIGQVWSSWVAKVLFLLAFGPSLIATSLVLAFFWATSAQAGPGAAPSESPVDAALVLRILMRIQLWLFVSFLTTRYGSGILTKDFTNRSFAFYFAKPVTPAQYLAGRILGLGVIAAALQVLPPLILVLPVLAGTGGQSEALETVRVAGPLMLYGAIAGLSLSTLSVATSGLGKSRSLTLAVWLLFFLVPYILSAIVEAVTGSQWLQLTSIPEVLGTICDALLPLRESTAAAFDGDGGGGLAVLGLTDHDRGVVRWYHAAGALAAMLGGGLYLVLRRLRSAEVVA